MQLDDAFPTPWKRVASADHRPLNALEPGAWERASAAAPGLFTNDVHAMTTGGARPQAAAPAANWEAPLANFGSSLDSVASHISSMIGASPHQPSPCASSHQAVHEQGLCPRTMGRVSARRACHLPPVAIVHVRVGLLWPKEINEQIDDRFCFGERCAAAALPTMLARRTPSWHARHTGAPVSSRRLRPACFRARDTVATAKRVLLPPGQLSGSDHDDALLRDGTSIDVPYALSMCLMAKCAPQSS